MEDIESDILQAHEIEELQAGMEIGDTEIESEVLQTQEIGESQAGMEIGDIEIEESSQAQEIEEFYTGQVFASTDEAFKTVDVYAAKVGFALKFRNYKRQHNGQSYKYYVLYCSRKGKKYEDNNHHKNNVREPRKELEEQLVVQSLSRREPQGESDKELEAESSSIKPPGQLLVAESSSIKPRSRVTLKCGCTFRMTFKVTYVICVRCALHL